MMPPKNKTATKKRRVKMNTINIIVSILAGLATAIPLVVKLIEYVSKAIKEKNWQQLLSLIMELMARAEANPDLLNGAARKQWVLSMVEAAADTINYDIDIEAVSALIDSLCALTNKVNV